LLAPWYWFECDTYNGIALFAERVETIHYYFQQQWELSPNRPKLKISRAESSSFVAVGDWCKKDSKKDIYDRISSVLWTTICFKYSAYQIKKDCFIGSSQLTRHL
jgi:hypothetical protein